MITFFIQQLFIIYLAWLLDTIIPLRHLLSPLSLLASFFFHFIVDPFGA